MADTQETINCPACGCEMKKIFIATKGINVDICTDGCGGIYFDNREIQEFSSPDDDLYEIKNALENKKFKSVDEAETRVCPTCSTPMAKTNAFGVQIDTCYKCGGIFLDNGEFEQIRTHYKKRPNTKQIKPEFNDFDISEFYKTPRKRTVFEVLTELFF